MPERDCAKCKRQAEWGCNAKQAEGGTWTNKALIPLKIDEEDWWGCPRRPIKDDPALWSELMFHYGMFKKGFLPDDGSPSAQAYRGIQLLRALEVAFYDAQESKSQEHGDG